jgi:hypothetical protein
MSLNNQANTGPIGEPITEPMGSFDPVLASDLYQRGYPLSALATLWGTSKERVRRALLAQGIPMRGRGGNQGSHSRHR